MNRLLLLCPARKNRPRPLSRLESRGGKGQNARREGGKHHGTEKTKTGRKRADGEDQGDRGFPGPGHAAVRGRPAFASADLGENEGRGDPAGGETVRHAVYLGVQDYGAVSDQAPGLGNFLHSFSVDGQVRAYPVSTGEAEGYALQNLLNEGYVYDVTVQDGAVTAVSAAQPTAEGRVVEISSDSITVAPMDGGARRSVSGIRAVYEIAAPAGGAAAEKRTLADVAVGDTVKVYEDTVYLTFVAEPYTPPVKGAPGVRTVKGFLSNAASGVGTALYIYGGGWVWQDESIEGSERWSNAQTRTIGVPQTWVDFFQRQDETFVYRSDDDPAHDYYSARNNYNQYGYAGGDPATKKHRLSEERRCFYRVLALFRGGP